MTDEFELDNSFELDGFVNFLNTFYEYYDKTIENMDFSKLTHTKSNELS